MRRTVGVSAVRSALGVVVLTGILAASAACGARSSETKTTPTASTAAPQSAATPVSLVDACAKKIDYWIVNYFLKGQPDHGDYQELGLSSSEGLALRRLEATLTSQIPTIPAPAPGNLHQLETTACTDAGAATPVNPNNPLGWP